MGTDSEAAAESARPRATAARAVGIMAAVALVSAGLVVGWARVGGAGNGSGALQPTDEEIPTTMAGGIQPGPVPAAIAEAFDQPVVAAAAVETLPPGVADACASMNDMGWEDEQPKLESAVATPDGLHLSMVGKSGMFAEEPGLGAMPEDGQKVRVTCSARHENGGWHTESGSVGPADPMMGDGAQGFSCCDADGFSTASAVITPPDGTAWVIQERGGGWYLAYPVQGGTPVTVTWRFREGRFGRGGSPASNVLFVDEQGETIGEDAVGGAF